MVRRAVRTLSGMHSAGTMPCHAMTRSIRDDHFGPRQGTSRVLPCELQLISHSTYPDHKVKASSTRDPEAPVPPANTRLRRQVCHYWAHGVVTTPSAVDLQHSAAALEADVVGTAAMHLQLWHVQKQGMERRGRLEWTGCRSGDWIGRAGRAPRLPGASCMFPFAW